MAHYSTIPPLTGPSNHFNNTGGGPQNNNTGGGPQNTNIGQGVQYNNTGLGTQNNSSSGNKVACKAPLPEGFIPAVIELAGRDRGDLNGPWTDPTSEEIKKIWIDLSPSDMKDKFSDYEKDITQTMTNVLIDWRNLFGKEAIKALEDELRKQNGERQKYVTDQTSSERFWDHKCYYKYPNEQPKTGFLQSSVVSQTFSIHFRAIGSVPIEELLKNKPTSALVLTILAIDRALRLCSSASTNSNSLSDELSGDNQAKERTSEAFKSLGLGVDASRWSRIIRFACKVEESAALPDNFA